MNEKSREDMGIAPLLIVGLMILAGLCVWCVSSIPNSFLTGSN